MLSRVLSLLLGPLLILGGAFAVLRAGGLIAGTGSQFVIPSTFSFHFPTAGTPLLVAVVGIAAGVIGLVMTFTIARFLKLLPIVGSVLLLVQLVVLAALIAVLFVANLL